MSKSHWFYMLEGCAENGWRILTYGLGNRPVGRHWFGTERERDAFVTKLLDDGYQFAKNQ